MKIIKALNNNVAVIKNEHGCETVIMGRGIAFQKKVGDLIDPSMVEKTFQLEECDTNHKFQQLLKNIPMSHMLISEEIIQYAKEHLNKELHDNIYVTLTDHISSAIDRYQNGIKLKNAMLWDIRQFYPDEFRMGLKAIEIVKEAYKIEFLEDEAAFIALHFVNAQINEDMTMVHDMTQLIQEITNIVKYHFRIEYDLQSLAYFRFVNHLKYFSQRLFKHENYEDDKVGMLDVIQQKHYDAFQCTEKIKDFIQKRYDYTLSDDEMLYMTVHIARIIRES